MAVVPCPCSGHLVFAEPPGSYDIRPVCFWEDDYVQRRWPDRAGGANSPSLIEAQRSSRELGATELRLTGIVRGVAPDEPIDDGWRLIDLEVDLFEQRGQSDGSPPDDLTLLSWWRPSFWRGSL